MVSACLRRGLAAGLLAGLLAGVFALFVGEPLLGRAVALEEAVAGAHHEEEVFSRPAQKVGLFFATGLFGTTAGGVFGLAYACLRRRLATGSEWGRSTTLAGAFAGVSLASFLKYPANPPRGRRPLHHRRAYGRPLRHGRALPARGLRRLARGPGDAGSRGGRLGAPALRGARRVRGLLSPVRRPRVAAPFRENRTPRACHGPATGRDVF